MKKMILSLLFISINIVITGIGASLGIKAAVGVGAWDALSQSLSTVIGMKIGTFSMLLNISCVVLQLLMLGKRFKPIALLQVFVAILLGYVVNFMYYTIYANIIIDNYFVNLILFVLSIFIIVIGVANIMAMNFISFPLEGACLVISDRFKLNFGKVRQGADILSIIIALVVAISFRDTITVREGTVIGMLLFGPLLDRIMRFVKPRLVKMGLVYNQ
ncbi:MAG TPA: hypothetical protein VFH18_07265 [Erysipelotrichaceae bacterium]|nr:hypothetical protein [Erysipelotrichaceae bacterium]